MDAKPYHHGDLRAALLIAAEAELAERGIEAFSLRSVAKRAGVSHAAPAHHFGDSNGLLTALAAEGYRQFLAAQAKREAVVLQGQTTGAQRVTALLVALGLGYVDFALSRRALFRLIFGSDRTDYRNPELQALAQRAYAKLNEGVQACGGESAIDIAATWAIAHGLADLLASGRLQELSDLPPPARDSAIVAIISRAMPGAAF